MTNTNASLLKQKRILQLITVICLLCFKSFAQTNKPNDNATVPVVPNLAPTNPYVTGETVNKLTSKQAIGRFTNLTQFNSATYTSVSTGIGYFDGLGRPVQTQLKEASPLTLGGPGIPAVEDIVQMNDYNELGLEPKQYLPYVVKNNAGFIAQPFTDQKQFYNSTYKDAYGQPMMAGENYLNGVTTFEESPINRPTIMYAPGNSWAGSNNGTTNSYMTAIGDDEVPLFSIDNNVVWDNNIPYSIKYRETRLIKNISQDENGNRVVEYKNLEGLTILKKVQLAAKPDDKLIAGWLCTFYVYDNYNQLRFVIPPKAVTTMNFSITQGTPVTVTPLIATNLCFRYEYDYRKRMCGKKVPGAGWVYMVYDKRDRLVFSQDANMRLTNQWMTTLYDELNRPISTGMMTYVGTRANLQTEVDNNWSATNTNFNTPYNSPADIFIDRRDPLIAVYKATNSVNFSEDFTSETGADFEACILPSANTANVTALNNPIPTSATYIALTYTYYDSYDINKYLFFSKRFTAAHHSKLDAGNNLNVEVLQTSPAKTTLDKITGTLVRTIKDPTNLQAGNFLGTVIYYDDYGRMLESLTDNHSGAVDLNLTRYNFTGQPVCTYLLHNNGDAGEANLRIKTNMEYDHGNRLLEMRKQFNDDVTTNHLIAKMNYDRMGKLLNKDLGTNPNTGVALEVLRYNYNIRGWLRAINKDYTRALNNSSWFGMELSYDWGFDKNQLNGNIGGIRWRSAGDAVQRAYGFDYDKVNRLIWGDFNQYVPDGGTIGWNKSQGVDFSMQMGTTANNYADAYDENGNILAMKQWGVKLNASSIIDQLQYNYNPNSNQLLNVIDAVNDPATLLGDFKTIGARATNTSNTRIDYTYDDNGNMKNDYNKDIKEDVGAGVVQGIVYNHLNLPWKINVQGKGTITYVYNALGVKLYKTTNEPASAINNNIAKNTVTDYHGLFTYENNKLQFIAQEEGRIRRKELGNNLFAYHYDYFIKDHLGNVRMVLTEEQKQDVYPAATLEANTASLNTEKLYYDIQDANIVTQASTGYAGTAYQNNNGNPPYNNNPNSNTTATSTSMYKLNGSANNKRGLGMALRVMSGDQINIFAKSYYKMAAGTTATNSYNILVNEIISALAGTNAVANSGKGATATTLNTSNTTTPLGSILNSVPTPAGNLKPKAYINWILFDEQFKAVNSGFDAVGASDVLTSHSKLVNIARNGYLYVYCSNESNVNVFFDNLQVIHNRGALLEETHYYPFGLTMEGITSKAAGSQINSNNYNGIEQNKNFDLNIYDAFYRNLDPQIGRFWQIDPNTNYSEGLYVSMGNNPIMYFDWLGNVVEYSNSAMEKTYQNMRKENNKLLIKYAEELVDLDFSSADEKVQDHISQLNNLIQYHNDLNSQWDEIENSEVKFIIGSEPNNKDNHGGRAYFDRDSYAIKISLNMDNERSISTLAHELRHGYGYLNGELSFGKELYDLTDEVVAYNVGALFEGRWSANAVAAGKRTSAKAISDNPNYSAIKGRYESLTVNTLAATVLKYNPLDSYSDGYIKRNSSNVNLTIGTVMSATNTLDFKGKRPYTFIYGNLLKYGNNFSKSNN
jgi:RHS repeat-associated protein